MSILILKIYIVCEVFFNKNLSKQKPDYRYAIVPQLLSKALETILIFMVITIGDTTFFLFNEIEKIKLREANLKKGNMYAREPK